MPSPWDKEKPEGSSGVTSADATRKGAPLLDSPLQVSADPKRNDDRLLVARLTLALKAGNIGVWQWDFTSNQLVWDARMYAMYGISEGTPITSDLWKSAVHPDDLSQAGGIFTSAAEQGLCQKHRFRILHPTKGTRYLEAAEELVLNAQGIPIACVGIDQDMTEWWEMRETLLLRQGELEKESLTDPLTGVGNRRSLDRSLANEVSRVRRYGGKLSFLIADMDDFKAINDQYGHETGDAALRTVAGAIASTIRGTDIVARFGGDEFCIVMPATGSSAARTLAERIRHRLEQAQVGNAGCRLTASFGIVQFRDGESIESLLHRADHALYEAKASGKNRAISNFGDTVRAALDEFSAAETQLQAMKIHFGIPREIRCVHCFRRLGFAGDPGERAAIQSGHDCLEGLLAKQPAVSIPYN